MQQAAVVAEIPRHGFDGNPPVMREPRDLPGSKERRKLDATQNIACDRLEWYHAHHEIEQHHVDAGRRLQGDRELAQIGGYAASGGTGVRTIHLVPSNLSDAKCDAIARVNRAKAALEPTVWHLLDLVVLQNIGLAVAAQRLWGGARRHERLTALVYALEKLAEHYGMA